MVGGFRHVQIVVSIFGISIIFHVPISMNQPIIQYRRSFRGVPSHLEILWMGAQRSPSISEKFLFQHLPIWYTGYTIIETNPWIFSEVENPSIDSTEACQIFWLVVAIVGSVLTARSDMKACHGGACDGSMPLLGDFLVVITCLTAALYMVCFKMIFAKQCGTSC